MAEKPQVLPFVVFAGDAFLYGDWQPRIVVSAELLETFDYGWARYDEESGTLELSPANGRAVYRKVGEASGGPVEFELVESEKA